MSIFDWFQPEKNKKKSKQDKEKDSKSLKREAAKEDGIEVLHEPDEDGDPKELKGTKLADCTFQAPCTGLA